MYIQGIDVVLHTTTLIGYDDFGCPIFNDIPITVKNVLVGNPTTDEAANELNLTGRRIKYVLSIPKGDAHDWTNKKVEFFGKTFRTYGEETEYIEALVPLAWNKQIKVEAYESSV